MFHGRLVQVIAIVVMAGALMAAGRLLPGIIEQSDESSLRYTSVSVENAPPEVVLGSAIGALRGIFVDVLWIRANIMKEKGLFYEANTLAELITRLQPRFASVWMFHGHNMAYNISVATHTEAERWEWVKKGIDLLRTEALVYNPNNVDLYRELAFYFLHKIEGISDDAHIYYKRMLCDEWHNLLGPPPIGDETWSERTEWIKSVADAPLSIEELELKTPGVMDLVEKYRAALEPYQSAAGLDFTIDFLNSDFLTSYSFWRTIQTSPYADVLGNDRALRAAAADPTAQGHQIASAYVALDALAADPAYATQWDALLAFVRKKVLAEEYNMDAQFMYELTRDWGPIDWRHGSAHAFYWSRRGELMGEARHNNDDLVYKIVNNDRMATASIQDMYRFGWISYDPLSGTQFPDRMPDIRWLDGMEKMFNHLVVKHEHVPGWGGDNFKDGYQNFLSSTVRELYRMGEYDKAFEVYDQLDRLFGRYGLIPNDAYSIPIDQFVDQQTIGEYAMQPHVATTDVQLALYYAIRRGLGENRPEVYERAKAFADRVLQVFRSNEYNNFVNKFGEERIAGIINSLQTVEIAVFGRILLDPSINLDERIRLYNVHAPLQVRQALYDLVKAPLRAQIEGSTLANRLDFDQVFPEPPGMEEYRQMQLQQQPPDQRERLEIDD
jgi:hypothetical protein